MVPSEHVQSSCRCAIVSYCLLMYLSYVWCRIRTCKIPNSHSQYLKREENETHHHCWTAAKENNEDEWPLLTATEKRETRQMAIVNHRRGEQKKMNDHC